MIAPVVIQQIMLAISSYVDNVMVNSYNTIAYTGVSTANRFMFILNFFWFGIGGGLTVFISQYYGAKNKEKIVGFIQLGLFITIIIGAISIVIVYFLGPVILRLLIRDGPTKQQSITYGITYLKYLSFGSIFWLFNVILGNTYRGIKRTYVPLIGGAIAISINIFLNAIMINGLWGFPELGTKGAAIATVISKFISNVVLVCIGLIKPKYNLIKQIFKKIYFNLNDLLSYIKKGSPIILNELLWALGMLLLSLFTTRGNEEWINIFNYSQNITDLFLVLFSGVSTGVLLFVGSALGEGDFKKAKDYSHKLFGLFILSAIMVLILLVLLSPALILIFTKGNINYIWHQTYYLILIGTPFVLIYGANNFYYFTLRAGGETLRAFLIDQLPTYVIAIPLAFFLGYMEPKWKLGLLLIFFITKLSEIIKLVFAYSYYKKDTWVNDITKPEEKVELT